MTRKLSFILVVALLLCVLVMSVSATNNKTYQIEELGISIKLPANLTVFTRNTSASDPNLSDYGFTRDSLLSLMEEQNVYLNALDDSLGYEIVVTMTAGLFENYDQLSDTQLLVSASALTNQYIKYGALCESVEIYPHNQTKFIEIYFSQNNGDRTIHSLQYNTTFNGQAINITLHSNSGPITQSQKQLLQTAVDNMQFKNTPAPKNPPASTEPFVYTDPATGLKFTVPANWVEEPMLKERQFIDAKFTSNLEEGLCIIFASEDLFASDIFEEEFSFWEQRLTSREMVDNSIFEEISEDEIKELLAEGLNGEVNSLMKCSYGGKSYYCADLTITSDVYGLSVTMPTVWLLRIENGYMYLFQFGGTTDNEYYVDFQELLNTVEYPYYEREISSTRLKIASTFVITIIMLGVLFYIFIGRKIHKGGRKIIATETSNGACPYCNAPQLGNGSFCHKCGKNLSIMYSKENE